MLFRWHLNTARLSITFAAVLFFGFTRIRYGLLWSILMHGLYNAVLIGTLLVTGEL